MENTFIEVMRKLTDDELIKVLTIDRAGYQPLAVEAADYVCKERNLDTSKVEEIVKDLNFKQGQEKAREAAVVSPWLRCLHFVVDSAIVFAITIGIFFIEGILAAIFGDIMNLHLGYIALLAAFFAYYVFMEHRYQKTVGKFITKTKVVTKTGERATLADIVRRTCCRLIPFDRGSFLIFPNGFHDSLSDTAVVKDGI